MAPISRLEDCHGGGVIINATEGLLPLPLWLPDLELVTVHLEPQLLLKEHYLQCSRKTSWS